LRGLQANQRRTLSDLLAAGVEQLGHHACERGADAVLHLHGFHQRQGLSGQHRSPTCTSICKTLPGMGACKPPWAASAWWWANGSARRMLPAPWA
jgi:hypothetical protein